MCVSDVSNKEPVWRTAMSCHLCVAGVAATSSSAAWWTYKPPGHGDDRRTRWGNQRLWWRNDACQSRLPADLSGSLDARSAAVVYATDVCDFSDSSLTFARRSLRRCSVNVLCVNVFPSSMSTLLDTSAVCRGGRWPRRSGSATSSQSPSGMVTFSRTKSRWWSRWTKMRLGRNSQRGDELRSLFSLRKYLSVSACFTVKQTATCTSCRVVWCWRELRLTRCLLF